MIPRQQIQSLADEIAAQFDVEKIILFGSHAYGKPREDSDVDLLVLMDFDGRPREQRSAIRRVVRPPFPWDLLLYRPEDFERRARQLDPVPHEALHRGVTLYDADRQRLAV